MNTTTTCNTCKIELPRTGDYFPTSKGKINGARCRTCTYAHNKAWRDKQPTCPIQGCEGKQQGQGLCITHYKHAFYRGFIGRKKILPFKDSVSYKGAHERVRQIRGYATNYTCEHCDKQAEDWALNHKQDKAYQRGMNNNHSATFSLDPYDYLPLCTKCHAAFDKKVNAA